jgi:hypothetical protein
MLLRKLMYGPRYFRMRVYCSLENAATALGLFLEGGRMSAIARAWLLSAKSRKSPAMMSQLGSSSIGQSLLAVVVDSPTKLHKPRCERVMRLENGKDK